MSRGSPRITIRLPVALRSEVIETIRVSKSRRRGLPHNFTTFFVDAVREKLDHMARSRASKKRSRG